MLTVNPFVVTKKHEEQFFIILEDNVFHLQGIAKDIWNYISNNDGCSTSDIQSFILSTYDVSEKKADKDVSKFLSQLEKEGIVTRA